MNGPVLLAAALFGACVPGGPTLADARAALEPVGEMVLDRVMLQPELRGGTLLSLDNCEPLGATFFCEAKFRDAAGQTRNASVAMQRGVGRPWLATVSLEEVAQ